MSDKTTKLSTLVNELNTLFRVRELDKDPAMSQFVPMVYKDHPEELRRLYEPEFRRRFNGLMIKGDKEAHTVFTASFPHDEILETFFSKSHTGDLLFLHHPIPLESGDPRGSLGRGFQRNNSDLLEKIKQKKLSIYACHSPLDYNEQISTNRSIAAALRAMINGEFLPFGNGYAGLIATIKPISTGRLIRKLKKIFRIPYVDFAGKSLMSITVVGIVAGGGDEMSYSQMAQEQGAEAYITGEIFSRYDSEWGRENTAKLTDYANNTLISLIGVSHAASEFLVMRTQMSDWFKKHFDLRVVPIAQKKWWY